MLSSYEALGGVNMLVNQFIRTVCVNKQSTNRFILNSVLSFFKQNISQQMLAD